MLFGASGAKPRYTGCIPIANGHTMLNIISIIIGLIALLAVALAFIPLLGWANWLIIPFAVIGLLLGLFSKENSGRNLNIVVIIIGVIRLWLGGGII